MFSVSNFESRNRNAFIKLIDEFNLDFSGLDGDLTVKLSDLTMFAKSDVTKGYLVAQNINFQNIDHVFSSFTQLLGKSNVKTFRNALGQHFMRTYQRNVDENVSTIDEIIKSAYIAVEKRNKIVHQNYKEIETDDAIKEIVALIDLSLLITELSAQNVDSFESPKRPRTLPYSRIDTLMDS